MKDDTTLIDEVLKKIPNKYHAVVIAAKRARDLNIGLAPMIKTDAAKPTTIALEEIASGAFTSEMAIKGIKAVKGVVEIRARQLPPLPKIDDEEIEEDGEDEDNG